MNSRSTSVKLIFKLAPRQSRALHRRFVEGRIKGILKQSYVDHCNDIRPNSAAF
jgi:hypothetical protein